MTIIVAQNDEAGFAKARLFPALSDHLTAFDCLLYWYFQAEWDREACALRPFKRTDLAKTFGVSVDTIKRSLKRLSSSGWVTFKDLGHEGQRPILHASASKPDTYHGFEDTNFGSWLKADLFARLTLDIITSGLSPRAIRAWVVLVLIRGRDEKKPEYGWSFIQYAELAGFISDPDRKLHRKTVASAVAELVELGLVEIDTTIAHGRMNAFRTFEELIKPTPPETDPEALETADEEFVPHVGNPGYLDVCVDLLDLWVIGVTGEDWRDNEDDDDGAEIDQVLDVIEAALKSTRSPALVRARIENGLEQYGFGCPLDFINKVLAEYLPEDEFDELKEYELEADSMTYRWVSVVTGHEYQQWANDFDSFEKPDTGKLDYDDKDNVFANGCEEPKIEEDEAPARISLTNLARGIFEPAASDAPEEAKAEDEPVTSKYAELAETHIELSPLPEAGNHYAENPLFNPAKRLAMYISR